MFDSLSTFSKLIRQFDNDLTPDEFQDEMEKVGFRSMVRYSNSMDRDPIRKSRGGLFETTDWDEDPAEIVEDYYFATILNEHGLVSVQGSIFRVTHDYVFWVGGTDPSILLNDAYLNTLVQQEVQFKQDQPVSFQDCEQQGDPLSDHSTGIYYGPPIILGDSGIYA